MKVREIITNALDWIGVNTVGVENLDGHRFQQNLRQLQLLVDTLRLHYPFRTTTTLTYSQLADVDFIDIESIVTAQDLATGPRWPMTSVELDEFNRLNIIPTVVSIPRWYYFQRPSLVQIYPINTEYEFLVTGKINNVANITADSELNPTPFIYQNYVEKKLGKILCVPYKKTLTTDQKDVLREIEDEVLSNTQTDTGINTPDSDVFFDRPKNYVRNL